MWHCDICDKTIIIKNKSGHNKSKSQKHKEKFSVVTKSMNFLDLILKNVLEIVIITIFTHSNLDVYMILKWQTVILSLVNFLMKKSKKLLEKIVFYIN